MKHKGHVGTLHGVRVEIDERVPDGKFYFINDNYLYFVSVDRRTRWQRIVDWVKGKLKRKS